MKKQLLSNQTFNYNARSIALFLSLFFAIAVNADEKYTTIDGIEWHYTTNESNMTCTLTKRGKYGLSCNSPWMN